MPPSKRRKKPAPRSAPRGGFNVEDYLESSGGGHKSVQYRRNAIVFSQGDPGADVRYIQKGAIQLSVLSRTGKEAVVAMLSPGDFFGEGALAGQAVRIATATAVTASSVLVIEKATMERLLHDEPTFSDRFIAYMLARNIRIEADLVDHLFNSSEKRLARTLLLLSRYGDAHPSRKLPKISQETLAEMIGATRSRVNFFMNKFRKIGPHRVQRRAEGQQLAAQRRSARLTAPARRRSRRYPIPNSPAASSRTKVCGSVGTAVAMLIA